MGYRPPSPPRVAGGPSELDRRRRPTRKAELLALHWVMIMAEVLPGDGDHKHWTRKQVRQDELAKMSGISRPSFTRRLSRCANQHGAADPRLNPVYEFIGR